MNFTLRPAVHEDLNALVELEKRCFEYDRLSRRNFQWMLTRANASLTLVEEAGNTLGYALVLFHQNTSLARLYSIAIDPAARGRKLGQHLLEAAEACAIERDCAYMRLEVRPDNIAAIALYERNGYLPFATVDDYYEDHSQALRFEKRIRQPGEGRLRKVPFYRQTTDFTCGPASLLMAMGALEPGRPLERWEELRLWREATTIYMTAGHGGCGPHGLALAARRRGFRVKLQVNTRGPLFLEGVRSEEKRDVMRLVHEDFSRELKQTDIERLIRTKLDIPQIIADGGLPLVLISSFRLIQTKGPHWIAVTGCDEDFIYFHDPDVDHSQHRRELDCQHIPVSHAEFDKLSRFGKSKLRAAVILYPPAPVKKLAA
ncbi:GNAT family N-acetyltransferase/peptidase C39 family protein [Pseudomonas sp. MAG002Y]|uniref:GNAT family N-acetyltransferase/peptidase C39 family protein n=1 Tax=Pseudomonas sp. MAG002Y TaxID=2678690 RepID=UPI001C609CBF|nr:GNAT family N-acetyltransferase/peptidase C39 family protein [Pseudomonas sp. MAG002Y]MBW5413209.1 GNAT family N-acetyltransferase [Pseudomonas sp. MAG002Y]